MKIGGLLKSSLIEYPELISAVIFTQGCNFRCPYCHNPELVEPDKFRAPIAEEEIMAFLETRRGLLDAVVVSGGEPTLNEDLSFFLAKIKKLGYRTKLDTNGTNPEILRELITSGLVDYIAMDIKAPFAKYPVVCGVYCDVEKIKESFEILKNTDVEIEFRTTAVENLHTEEDIITICEMIPAGKRFFLQKFQPNKTLDISYLQKSALSSLIIDRLKEKTKQYAFTYSVR